MTTSELTAGQAKLLLDIGGGADIYGHWWGRIGRELETLGLVIIVPAMNAPSDGAVEQPMYGAGPSPEGRKVQIALKQIAEGKHGHA